MFFRGATGAFAPTAAFVLGARSASFLGTEISRRHCARARSSLLRGFIDPKAFLSSSAGACGLTTVISALAAQVAATRAMSMSASEVLDMAMLADILEVHATTVASVLGVYVPSGRCGLMPVNPLFCLEEIIHRGAATE
jgi:hypothetical protein